MYKFYRENNAERRGAVVWGAMKIMINNNDMRFSPALNMYNKFSSSRRVSARFSRKSVVEKRTRRMKETRRGEIEKPMNA